MRSIDAVFSMFICEPEMWNVSLSDNYTYSVFAALPQAKTQAQRLAWCFFFANFRREAARSSRLNSEKDVD